MSPIVAKDTLALYPETEKKKNNLKNVNLSVSAMQACEFFKKQHYFFLPLKAVKVVVMKHRNVFHHWSLKVAHASVFFYCAERERDREGRES